ncbi:hypothetical protein [Microbacterium sp.]|nr:hypothetical protein [Microbacterium sp.]
MTAHVVALAPTERQHTSEKQREHPEGVLPLFVVETGVSTEAEA